MDSLRKKFQKPDFILAQIFIPLAGVVFNCVSFAYFNSRILFLPSGVNHLFVSRFWKYALVAAAASYLYLYLLFKSKKAAQFNFQHRPEPLAAADLLLILLPLTPVVQYILQNQSILSPLDSLSALLFFTLLASLYSYFLPAILGIVSSARTLMISGLAFVFTLTSMALLSQQFSWYESGNLVIQAGFFVGTFLTLWLLYNLAEKRVLHLLIGVVFLINTGLQLISQQDFPDRSSPAPAEESLIALIGDKEPVIKPNIYLLIYDGYAAGETLTAQGIDNTPQEDYLTQQGFVLYPQTYSIGAGTLTTMSSLLNISPDEVLTSRSTVSGGGQVHTLFRSIGYVNYGLFTSDFFFRGSSSSYDYAVPESSAPPAKHLVNLVLMGEFRFDLGFDYQTREEFLDTKNRVLGEIPPEPLFIYIHSDLPNHSQNSGACLFYETETYQERLSEANTEMRADITAITNHDPGAMIIIAGDHGPYLTKNCTATAGEYAIEEITRLDIQDRYGTFLAIRWPTDAFDPYDEITVLQDLFPAIFSYLYQDSSLLESKIDPVTISPDTVSGAAVRDGVIVGGSDAGERLFLSGRQE